MEDKKKILIVDDEADFVDVLKIRLEFEGYEVATASDGLAALDALLRKGVDLILLDIMMPRMDGFTFYKTLKEEERVFPIPPIIIITAYSRLLTEEKRKLIGDLPVMPKPFDIELLLKKMKEML